MKTKTICGIAKCGESVEQSIAEVVDRIICGDVLVLELICRLRIERAIDTVGQDVTPPSIRPVAA